MPDLEQELRELGATVEYPPTPDIATEVRQRLAAQPARRRFPVRRAVVLAFAALAVAVGAAMAVPQARTAILEWLGLRGVTIERVPTQPTAPEGVRLDLGDRVSLSEAEKRAGYVVLVPTNGLGEPQEIYFNAIAPDRQVAFVFRSGGEVNLLITQFPASLREEFIHKSIGPGTTIARVTVNGEEGYWIEGEPHEFVYVDERGEPLPETLRLAGNTLLWERGELTLRLEGDLTKEEALRIAESIR